jgi:hypothetical protein
MKRFEPAAFAIAVLMFVLSGVSPLRRAEAQMAYDCPGGSTLLCGTERRTRCVEIDARTNLCSKWKEDTLYYYYAGGGSSCGERVCQN